MKFFNLLIWWAKKEFLGNPNIEIHSLEIMASNDRKSTPLHDMLPTYPLGFIHYFLCHIEPSFELVSKF